MKKIVKRSNGGELTVEEALALCKKVKAKTDASYVERTSVCSYKTADMAIKADFAALCKTYSNYVFAFAGTINKPEDYKVHVIAIKIRPSDFENHFQDYVVLEWEEIGDTIGISFSHFILIFI